MGTLIFAVILCLAISWPSMLVSRIGVAHRPKHSGFGWFAVGPISAAVIYALAYFLFPFFVPYPSGSPKELESFLVNRGAIPLLLACVAPWVVYFGIKIYCRKNA